MTQIFLCHANEDKPKVWDIYKQLKDLDPAGHSKFDQILEWAKVRKGE